MQINLCDSHLLTSKSGRFMAMALSEAISPNTGTVQNGLDTSGWEGAEEIEGILSSPHGYMPQEAAEHVLGSLDEQERWGGSAAGQVLVETHLGNFCLVACLLCKGKARDVFGQCNLKKSEFLMVALRKEKGKRQTIICTLFGSSSHTSLLIMVPVNFKWETLQISSASLTSVQVSKFVILDCSYHGTWMYCSYIS